MDGGDVLFAAAQAAPLQPTATVTTFTNGPVTVRRLPSGTGQKGFWAGLPDAAVLGALRLRTYRGGV